MAQDITEQADQEAVAESLVTDHEEAQEPQEQTGTEELEQQPAEQEEPLEEEADDWLPTEQEKVFPDDVLQKYATRYNVDLAKADPQLRQLIHDKINSDIYLRTIQQQREQEPEYEEPEPEPESEPTPQQPQLTRDQYFQSLSQMVQQRTDPQVAQEFYGQFMKAFGVPENEITALAPQQAMAFTQTMSTYALNLINTFANDLFGANIQHYVEQAYPQFGQMFQKATAASTWDSVRNSVEGGVELPAYGTKDFAQNARAIGAQIAGSAERFEQMVFTDRQGRPLSPSANIAEKHRMIAERMLAGSEEQVTPAIVAQAVQTGQRLAQRSQATRGAGNLGSGKSRGQIAQQSDDDDIFKEGLEIYKIRQGSL